MSTITAKPSKAKVRTVTVGGVDHAVRFLTGTSPSPYEAELPAKVIEVDGELVGWLRCYGKAYGDPSLPSNYSIVADGKTLWLEGYSREEAVARWLRSR